MRLFEERAIARQRVEGVLVPSARIAGADYTKVVGGCDVTDRLRPQDGRTCIGYGGQIRDVRIATAWVLEARTVLSESSGGIAGRPHSDRRGIVP
jgi:type II secretory ATPase GspE/PulE/Tfp pilus assembly ATPase PilB-like protein